MKIFFLDVPIFFFSEKFLAGLAILEENNVPFDFNDAVLKHIPTIAAKFPNLKMVVDHLNKPDVPKGQEEFNAWKEIIDKLGNFPNVYMKLSGMVVLAEPWTKEMFKPYVDHCLKVFGPKRYLNS